MRHTDLFTKSEIFWNEPRGFGDIAEKVTHGRTKATFNGKIRSFHGFNYNGIGSLCPNKIHDLKKALAELKKAWSKINFQAK